MIKVANGILVKEAGILDTLKRMWSAPGRIAGQVASGANTIASNPNYASLAKTPYLQSLVRSNATRLQPIVSPVQKTLNFAQDYAPHKWVESARNPNTTLGTAFDAGKKLVAPFAKPYNAGLRDARVAAKATEAAKPATRDTLGDLNKPVKKTVKKPAKKTA